MMRRLVFSVVFAVSLGLATNAVAQQQQEQQPEDEQQQQEPADEPDQPEEPAADGDETDDETDDEDLPRALFDRGQLFEDLDFTGFGGPEIKFSGVVGNVGTFLGGRAGIVLENVLVLGGAGYGLASSPSDVPLVDGQRPSVGMGYGGALVEGLIYPESILHANVGGIVGFGNVSYHVQSDSVLGQQADSTFFVADVYGAAELNVTTFLQTALGIGYRFTAGAALPGLDDSDISSPTVHMIIKFGKFD